MNFILNLKPDSFARLFCSIDSPRFTDPLQKFAPYIGHPLDGAVQRCRWDLTRLDLVHERKIRQSSCVNLQKIHYRKCIRRGTCARATSPPRYGLQDSRRLRLTVSLLGVRCGVVVETINPLTLESDVG